MTIDRRTALGTLAGLAAASAVRAAPAKDTPMAGHIDTHNHFLPKVYIDTVGLADLASVMPNRIAPEWSADKAIATMDAIGTATSVISISSGPPIPNAAKLLRQCNDFAADLAAKHPGRFGSFASLPLPDIDASLKEVVYSLDTLKADGVIVFTSYDGKYLGDQLFVPLFEELNRRKAVVFIHPNHPPYDLPSLPPASVIEFPFDTTRTATSLLMSGALRRFPGIKFILSHAGGTLPFLAQRIAGGVIMNPSLAERVGDPMAAMRQFWFDTALSGSKPQIAALMAFADPAKVLFGTDFPMAPKFAIEMVTAGLKAAPLPDGVRDGVFRNNAAQLLRRV